jgi:hypothetical protein
MATTKIPRILRNKTFWKDMEKLKILSTVCNTTAMENSMAVSQQIKNRATV